MAHGWRVMGGVLWLDTKATGIDDPAVNGKRIYATPSYIVSGRVEYDAPFLRGLTLAAGAIREASMIAHLPLLPHRCRPHRTGRQPRRSTRPSSARTPDRQAGFPRRG